MENESIHVPYNVDLQSLEKLLAGVRRPGDFYAQGALELPLPRIEVTGVGVLSFPVPDAQVQQIIQQAERAPYGRGAATLLDTSVRKVWQVTPEKVRLGGKSWEKSFQQILAIVVKALGCAEVPFAAELYKLLVYDEGSFFLAHRDTEKAPGMFATLVIVLPCPHRGGELVIRHAGREVVVELSSAEVSELTFSAFYADCEHEVKPVTQGNRVCLVYNLLQQRTKKNDGQLPTAPLYDSEVAAAAEILKATFNQAVAPAKIAWLLEHQYSPAELSFTTLKNADVARVKVLREAADRADCATHLGIVHIEEFGPAQPQYDGDGYGRSSRRGRYYDDEEVVEEDVSSNNFEVIEVSDGRQFIDQWINTEDRAVDFGELSLQEGEVLPAGALDDEEPDEQRLTEATGNAGASFERSYHRAALVLWPLNRFADVLLQSGVGAALPYLNDRVKAVLKASASSEDHQSVMAVARRIVETWEHASPEPAYGLPPKAAARSEMIRLLCRLGDVALLEHFIDGVVTRDFDGSENQALVTAASQLGPQKTGKLFSNLAQKNMPLFHRACVSLLAGLVGDLDGEINRDWLTGFREIGAAIVEGLPRLAPLDDERDGDDWWRAEKSKPVDAGMVAELLECLATIDAQALAASAAAAIVANVAVFNPATAIVPALEKLAQRDRGVTTSITFQRLWSHAAKFLLARSEQPPESPKDWRQAVKLSCKCTDCRELQKFVLDPNEQTHQFRVRKDRRQHLHQHIERDGLDMTHVTDRKGSPQTLVCTKTRRTYQRQCAQHKTDLLAMSNLLQVGDTARGEMIALATRMIAASGRSIAQSPLPSASTN